MITTRYYSMKPLQTLTVRCKISKRIRMWVFEIKNVLFIKNEFFIQRIILTLHILWTLYFKSIAFKLKIMLEKLLCVHEELNLQCTFVASPISMHTCCTSRRTTYVHYCNWRKRRIVDIQLCVHKNEQMATISL